MTAKQRCDLVYNQCKALYPINSGSWETLRRLIQTLKDIAYENNIIIYNIDLNVCMDKTWNKSGATNGTKKDFEQSRDQVRDTAFHMASTLPEVNA